MKQFVVGSPYTTETTLGAEDEYLIVACDGVSFHSLSARPTLHQLLTNGSPLHSSGTSAVTKKQLISSRTRKLPILKRRVRSSSITPWRMSLSTLPIPYMNGTDSYFSRFEQPQLDRQHFGSRRLPQQLIATLYIHLLCSSLSSISTSPMFLLPNASNLQIFRNFLSFSPFLSLSRTIASANPFCTTIRTLSSPLSRIFKAYSFLLVTTSQTHPSTSNQKVLVVLSFSSSSLLCT